MAGNILAMQLSPPEPSVVLPWSGVAWEDGWRAMLAVNRIVAKVQTTVFYGTSLYMIWYSIGTLSPQEGFSFFLKSYYNKPVNYGQLITPPYAAVPAQYRMLVSTPPPPPPETQGVMTLLNSGYYPLYGYWMEFAGNFFLTSPIFQDWPSVIRDGPNYKGFQPSSNNPGTGGSGGSGNSGQGC